MTRLVALVLGVVVVGLLVSGVPWRAGAQDDDERIAEVERQIDDQRQEINALKIRVATLENQGRQGASAPVFVDLSCASISLPEAVVDPIDVTEREFGEQINAGDFAPPFPGSVALRGCTVTASP